MEKAIPIRKPVISDFSENDRACERLNIGIRESAFLLHCFVVYLVLKYRAT